MGRCCIPRWKACQYSAACCLLFWLSTSFAGNLTIANEPSRINYLYWFFALLACLLAGYFMGSRRRLDEETYQAAIEKKLSTSELRLRRQQVALAILTNSQLKEWQDPTEVFRQITKVSAEALNVERVGIWLFNDDKTELECVDLYLKSKNSHSAAESLRGQELPEYFKYISRHRVIAANDIMQHSSTVEFAKSYAKENNIGAMLDGTIWLNNEVVGVVCHEHMGGEREWTLDEQSFAGSVADFVQITIETHSRRKVEADLLDYQKNLENIIKDRTATIERNTNISRFLVERAPVCILYMNASYQIIDINPEGEHILGYKRESIIGENYLDLFCCESSLPEHQALFARVLAGDKVQGHVLPLQHADGHVIELSISRTMELDSDGKPVIISIGQDVSQQKALEASLVKAREAAESADRIKSMFVASMSHELRTPLNSIIGFLGVVLQGMSGELNLKQKDQLGRAYHSSKHLLSLITDVIDISKIEAGFLQVHVEKFELATLLTEVQYATQHLAQEKQLQLIIECPTNIKLDTDRKRLYQVVLNVVSNALKYTEQGSVKVVASTKGKYLVIAVHDTGIGIDEADQANLFKPFERIESHLKIKTLGTGLGLYLTKKILTQLLTGEISVSSQLGEGSIFTIKVPVKISKLLIQNHTSILENSLPLN